MPAAFLADGSSRLGVVQMCELIVEHVQLFTQLRMDTPWCTKLVCTHALQDPLLEQIVSKSY